MLETNKSQVKSLLDECFNRLQTLRSDLEKKSIDTNKQEISEIIELIIKLCGLTP